MTPKICAPMARPPATTPWYRQPRWRALALFVFGVALYANTWGHDFALDDAIVITDNSLVQRGAAGVADIFRHDTFYGFFNDDGKASLVAGGRYRPLTPALFALEREVSAGPTLHHVLNTLWYGLLVVVVFGFVRELTRSLRWAQPLGLALPVATLFAAHPLHTEAVANIKGRDEILALLFALAGSWLVLRAARHQRFWGAVAGAGLVFLGCLAKENAVTFVGVIPVVLWLTGAEPGGWGRLRYAGPTLVAVAAFLALRTAVVGWGLGEPTAEVLNNPFLVRTADGWTAMPAGNRLATVMHTLWVYLRLLFVPVGLVHDYYPMAVPMKHWGQLTPWLGLGLHLALAAFAVLRWRRFPYAALGVVVYLFTLSIVSNVFFSVGTNMSERFLFMPSLGWALAVGALLNRLTRRRPLMRWATVGVVAALAVLTVLRNPVWKDNFTLFTTDVVRQPQSAKLRNAAGGVRIDAYQALPAARRATSTGLLDDAVRDLTYALKLHPTYKNAYLLRGNAYLLLDRYDPAIADYDRALELDPAYAAARDNLVTALTAAGQDAGERRGDLGAAFRYLRRAEQLAPNDYETLRLLGVASGVSGQTAQALDYFRRATTAAPTNAEAHWNYAIALYNAGRTGEAEASFREAERLKPGIRQERSGR